METDPGLSGLGADYRLADFKVLLPLGPSARLLVIALSEVRFLRHLAGEVGTIDLAVGSGPESGPRLSDALLAAFPDPTRVRRLQEPAAADYDLVLSDRLTAGRYLRPGGILCRFLGHASEQPPADLVPLGRWLAHPDWPAFRALIPDNRPGWQAATRDLRLFPPRSVTSLAGRLAPELAGRSVPERGLALYARAGAASIPTLLGELQEALATSGAPSLRATPADHWLLTSGRPGPGNPILLFSLEADGHPRRLIKTARYLESEHLGSEANKIAAIEARLGPDEAARVIRPTAVARVAGRWALAYDFAPTHAFFGIRWRLQGQRGYCLAVTRWLAAVALSTRRSDAEAVETHQLAPLRRLVARRILPAESQRQAESALTELTRLASTLHLILEHGDLGIYNTRLTRADGSDFRVLDWNSSTFDGIPLGDLGYLLCSARAPVTLATRCIRDYLARLGLQPRDASALWYGFLARRWEELDGVRPTVAGDPSSGGGILLPIERQVAAYLRALTPERALG